MYEIYIFTAQTIPDGKPQLWFLQQSTVLQTCHKALLQHPKSLQHLWGSLCHSADATNRGSQSVEVRVEQ